MMGMYFTIQLVTLERSILLQIKSIFIVLNPENVWFSWKIPEIYTKPVHYQIQFVEQNQIYMEFK